MARPWTQEELDRMDRETSRPLFDNWDTQNCPEVNELSKLFDDSTAYWEKLFEDVRPLSYLGVLMKLLAKPWIQKRPWLKKINVWLVEHSKGYKVRKADFDETYGEA